MGCRRPIRSPESVAAGYGAGCRAKMRKTVRTADLSAWTACQAEEARQAIEDGAVVPSARPGVFHVVSTDGTEVHRVHRDGCNCTNGLQTRPPRPCWHRLAVVIALAAPAPAPRPAATAAPAATALPAPVTVPDDFWAAIDATTDALMAIA